MSEDEYLDQSRVETEKALRNLRDYCQSPKCSPWKLTSRLDSPTRFAEFVQGKILAKHLFIVGRDKLLGVEMSFIYNYIPFLLHQDLRI